MQFKCTHSASMVGLQIRASTTTQSYSSLDYAVYCRPDGVFYAYESGSQRFRDSKQYGAGTSILELSVTDAGRVQYIVDGRVAYTSTKLVPKGTDLHVAVAFSTPGAVTDITARATGYAGKDTPVHAQRHAWHASTCTPCTQTVVEKSAKVCIILRDRQASVSNHHDGQ